MRGDASSKRRTRLPSLPDAPLVPSTGASTLASPALASLAALISAARASNDLTPRSSHRIVSMVRFLFGAFVELCQLLLVLVAALFAVQIAVGNPGAFVLLVVYGLLEWWPARDLVEGWLGMVSRRLPDRYEDRGENLGRGVMGVAFAIFWTVLWFVADQDQHTKVAEAFDRAYVLLARAIFGLGVAVPRLWFGYTPAAWP